MSTNGLFANGQQRADFLDYLRWAKVGIIVSIGRMLGTVTCSECGRPVFDLQNRLDHHVDFGGEPAFACLREESFDRWLAVRARQARIDAGLRVTT